MTVIGAEAARPARARPTTKDAAFLAKAEGKVKTGRGEGTRRIRIVFDLLAGEIEFELTEVESHRNNDDGSSSVNFRERSEEKRSDTETWKGKENGKGQLDEREEEAVQKSSPKTKTEMVRWTTSRLMPRSSATSFIS